MSDNVKRERSSQGPSDQSGPSSNQPSDYQLAPVNASIEIRMEDGSSSSSSDPDSDGSTNMFDLDSPLAGRKRRRTDKIRQSRRDKKVSKSQRQAMIKNLVNFKDERAFCDYKIIVPGHSPIHVHKLVLAAASTYFKRVLESGMQEAISGEIHMKEISYETVQILVNFSYGQNFEINNSNAQEVLEAADCYEYNILKDTCEKFLLQNIDTQNCFDFLQLADLRRLYILKEKAMQFALKNFAIVIESEDFLDVPLSILQQFLSDNAINIKREEQIFTAGLKWLKHDKENRSVHGFEVLNCVRLARVAPRFLLDMVEAEEIFDNDKCRQVINQAKKYLMLPFEERKQEECLLAAPRNSSGVQEVLVVIGGICNNKKLKEVDYYNSVKGWQSLADISTDHQNMHSYSVIAHDNDIYITGGHSSSQCTVDIVSVFSSRYKQWRMLTRMNQARERHGSACVDGHIYVVGGLMAGKQKRKPGVLSEVERFNPRTQYWENVESLPRRCYSPGVINYKNKLYVIGGVSMTDDSSSKNANSSQTKVLLDLVQVYCPVTDKWTTQRISKKLARLSCALFNDYVYIIANNSNIVHRYCPNNHILEEWLVLDSVNNNLEFAGLAAYKGKLYISGGQQEENTLSNVICIDILTKEILPILNETLRRPLCMHGCVVIDYYGDTSRLSPVF